MSLLAALLLAAPAAAAKPAAYALFVQRSDRGGAAVWRVHADGRTERLPGDFPEASGGSLWEGTSLPVPSPDRQRLSFLDRGQIHVRDLGSGGERAVTALEDPKSRFRLSITSWSADSRSLLYHVGAPIPEKSGDDCGGQIPSGFPVEYRIQDMDTGKDRLLSVPGGHAIVHWLPDGSFVLESLVFPHTWGTWREGDPEVRPLTKVAGDFYQFASDSGTRVVTTWSDAKAKESRIGIIQATGGSFEPVSPPCGWGECGWGTFSPSGERIAYVHTCRTARGDPERAHLLVECLPVFTCAGNRLNDYVWVNDETIALRCGDELIVVDAENGSVKSRTALPALEP